MSSSPAQQLRLRAAGLRGLARQLQSLRALTLYADAGADTWVGPSPQRCADDLMARRSELLQHADDLAQAARRMERQADELDAQAAAPGAPR